ncbi:MAG: imidazoleglycerol-phosphate dehydratase [Candidatus Epulonipiscioides saccharophilum]|nr:MAG: imidazoleglycerol-phosphate dehydratase [Epulopiscium sp. AS2M-Bin001]
MRKASIRRRTNETSIELLINLDGSGQNDICTDSGFLNHMLTLFSVHSKIDLKVSCLGDTDVDFHHSVEDIAICLGRALEEALGDKKGINRYGNCILPMDEALVGIYLDFSGRSLLVENINITQNKVGHFDTELCKEFLVALARSANMTIHVDQQRGTNAHHVIEAIFKTLAKAIRQAVKIDAEFSTEIPSSKGVI